MLPAFSAAAAAAAIPDDPDFDLQWGLHNVRQTVDGRVGQVGADIGAVSAWDIHQGTGAVTVGIVGRGIDPHPEFADRLLEGFATTGDLFDSLDSCPHDTHLAGIISAATGNGAGVAGINGRAWLLPVRSLDGCGGSPTSVAAGVIRAVDDGARVLLVPVQFAVREQELADAVAYAVARDVIVVAPTGSAGNNEIAYPAAYEGCLAVSATTNGDTISDNSNYGAEVDLAAPGSWIWSTWTGGGYAYQPEGRDTANASAFVAGVAALVWSYAPQLSARQVADILTRSADDLGEEDWDEHFGAGRVNARRALELAPPPALRFERVGPLPATIAPQRTSTFVIRIAGVAETVVPATALVYHRVEPAEFASTPLVPLGEDLFRVELPPVTCGSTPAYYLAATGHRGSVVTEPLNAPANVHAAHAIISEAVFSDDFEQDQGWETVVEGGDQTRGAWERVAPFATIAQPGFDATPDYGRHCFVTGQYHGGWVGLTDVDVGPVRLVSPLIPLSADDAEIGYAAWFHWSGVGEEDVLTVELSRDGGQSWHIVETLSSTDEWVKHSFRLRDLPGVTGDELRVRFSTEDIPNDSLTEAAIDEFHVRSLRCGVTPGDGNGDGVVDWTDWSLMSGCRTGPTIPAPDGVCGALDFDSNGHTDLADCAAFQNAFLTP